jgi:hypothetical protein
MKKALFYTFLGIFIVTAGVTLLGIAGLIRVNDKYLTPLFYSLIIELVGVVIAIARRADFLNESPERDLKKYRPSADAGRVLGTLWTYQIQHCGYDKSKLWAMTLPPDRAQIPTFYRGLADLIEVGLADINPTDRMAHLTSEGFDYCQRNAEVVLRNQTFKF